jgi:hypothetical protein
MAAKTTVLIGQQSGPHVVPSINYQAWAAVDRIRSDGMTTLPAFQPVELDPVTGFGSVEVEPGLWRVAEFVPQNESPIHVWRVPASDEPVHFTDLVEENDTDQIGYGPTWAEQARISAITAVAAAREAAGYAEDAGLSARAAAASAALAGAPRYSVSTDGKTASFEASSYVTPSADGKYLTISGGNIASGFRVPRLGADGLYRTEQLPLNAIVNEVLEAMPEGLVETAILAALNDDNSAIRARLAQLFAASGGGASPILQDTDGVPYLVALGVAP